jgi:hypothetical protein
MASSNLNHMTPEQILRNAIRATDYDGATQAEALSWLYRAYFHVTKRHFSWS